MNNPIFVLFILFNLAWITACGIFWPIYKWRIGGTTKKFWAIMIVMYGYISVLLGVIILLAYLFK